jgi:hypothetical protein
MSQAAHACPRLCRPPPPPQVWTASERAIAIADAATGAPLFALPEQEGFVKWLAPAGWGVWAGGAGGIKVFAAQGAWQEARDKVRPWPRAPGRVRRGSRMRWCGRGRRHTPSRGLGRGR